MVESNGEVPIQEIINLLQVEFQKIREETSEEG